MKGTWQSWWNQLPHLSHWTIWFWLLYFGLRQYLQIMSSSFFGVSTVPFPVEVDWEEENGVLFDFFEEDGVDVFTGVSLVIVACEDPVVVVLLFSVEIDGVVVVVVDGCDTADWVRLFWAGCFCVCDLEDTSASNSCWSTWLTTWLCNVQRSENLQLQFFHLQ